MGLKGREFAVREIFTGFDRHQFRSAIKPGDSPSLIDRQKQKTPASRSFSIA
ncbi:MAG: hypothetical protein J7562_18265 [Agrobacterium tumefaciens]|nr:hypothetical protein [Agrobacterium tumefaciens]